jgi:hypothetical protein
MKKDLMLSKIISRAACRAELTSNPKSFFNCPDLHGGVPGLLGGRICRGELANFKLQAVQSHPTVDPNQESPAPPCDSGHQREDYSHAAF